MPGLRAKVQNHRHRREQFLRCGSELTLREIVCDLNAILPSKNVTKNNLAALIGNKCCSRGMTASRNGLDAVKPELFARASKKTEVTEKLAALKKTYSPVVSR